MTNELLTLFLAACIEVTAHGTFTTQVVLPEMRSEFRNRVAACSRDALEAYYRVAAPHLEHSLRLQPMTPDTVLQVGPQTPDERRLRR